MKYLALASLLAFAGCATRAPVAAPAPRGDVEALRAEVSELKAEVGRLRGRAALREFRAGKRVSRKRDLRAEPPAPGKGVRR